MNQKIIIIPDAILNKDIAYVKAGLGLEIRSISSYVNDSDYFCNCSYYPNNELSREMKNLEVHISEMTIQNVNRLKFLMKSLHQKK